MAEPDDVLDNPQRTRRGEPRQRALRGPQRVAVIVAAGMEQERALGRRDGAPGAGERRERAQPRDRRAERAHQRLAEADHEAVVDRQRTEPSGEVAGGELRRKSRTR